MHIINRQSWRYLTGSRSRVPHVRPMLNLYLTPKHFVRIKSWSFNINSILWTLTSFRYLYIMIFQLDPTLLTQHISRTCSYALNHYIPWVRNPRYSPDNFWYILLTYEFCVGTLYGSVRLLFPTFTWHSSTHVHILVFPRVYARNTAHIGNSLNHGKFSTIKENFLSKYLLQSSNNLVSLSEIFSSHFSPNVRIFK